MFSSEGMKKAWKEFRVDPLWHAGVEVLLTVIMTFLPLLLLSMPIIKGGEDFSEAAIANNFSSYLNSGEIVLPILSICGTMLAILGLHSRKFRSPWIVLSIIATTVLLLVSGYVLGTNRGFSGELQSPVFYGLIALYVVAVVFWFFMTWTARKEGETRSNAEERANQLLKQLHAQQAPEEAQ